MGTSEEIQHWMHFYNDLLAGILSRQIELEPKESAHLQAAKWADELLDHMKKKWPDDTDSGRF